MGYTDNIYSNMRLPWFFNLPFVRGTASRYWCILPFCLDRK